MSTTELLLLLLAVAGSVIVGIVAAILAKVSGKSIPLSIAAGFAAFSAVMMLWFTARQAYPTTASNPSSVCTSTTRTAAPTTGAATEETHKKPATR